MGCDYWVLLIVCASLGYTNAHNTVINVKHRECKRPNGTRGLCMPISECASVNNVHYTKFRDIPHWHRLRCNGHRGPFPWICCDLSKVPTSTQPPAVNRTERNSFPGTDKCGVSVSDNRIYSGQKVQITDFPWLALLEFASEKNHSVRSYDCAATLINQRYVLTAAHCIAEEEKWGMRLVNVRLGEYDTTKEVDCDGRYCADALTVIAVDKIVTHRLYNETAPNQLHDIALIRLAIDVQYTDFIRPICMPSVVGLNRTAPGTNLTASGWGRIDDGTLSPIKLKVELPVFDQLACAALYAKTEKVIEDSQLCAGGRFRVDVCDGDSGGPLMVLANKQYWTIEGIISWGYGCGLEVPGVYTRVSSYARWILDTMMAAESTK